MKNQNIAEIFEIAINSGKLRCTRQFKTSLINQIRELTDVESDRDLTVLEEADEVVHDCLDRSAVNYSFKEISIESGLIIIYAGIIYYFLTFFEFVYLFINTILNKYF